MCRYLFAVIIFFSVCVAYPLTQAPLIASSSTRQLFIEPDSGRAPLLQAINQARQEIDVVMYLFTDQKLAVALKQAAERGVSVKILIEKSPYDFKKHNQWLMRYWNSSKVQWQWVPSTHSSLNFYHQKTMLIDHRQAWVMTLNFTKSSFSKKNPERNFILLDQNLKDVNEIEAVFEKDWAQKNLEKLSLNHHLVLSPVNTRQQLEGLVLAAHQRIKIYAAALEDYQFIGALAKIADHKIAIKIIYNEKLRENTKAYLIRHGIQLHQAKQLANHAKLLIWVRQISLKILLMIIVSSELLLMIRRLHDN
jgi:hypothetical protein